MGRLLTVVVAAFAFALFAVTLVIAQEGTTGGGTGDAAVVTNELGTPCASLPASPVASPMATPAVAPEASPMATPETIIMGGCETAEATPGN